MKSKTGVGIYLTVIALVLASVACYVAFKNQRKIGYVLVTNLFNEFELKKEMELKYTAAKNARKKIIDSLQVDLSVLSGRIKNNTAIKEDKDLFERKRIEYNQKMQLFDEDNVFMSK